MTPVRTIETQCTHTELTASLPSARGHRRHEIIDDAVIVDDRARRMRATVHHEPIGRLGSLELPSESVRFGFDGCGGGEARALVSRYRRHAVRSGGG